LAVGLGGQFTPSEPKHANQGASHCRRAFHGAKVRAIFAFLR